MLRAVYKGVRGIARDGIVRMNYTDIARTLELDKVSDRTVSRALHIFDDEGLVEIGEDDEGRYVRFLNVDGKVDLERNERFAEGEAERESFKRFCAARVQRTRRGSRAHYQSSDLSAAYRARAMSEEQRPAAVVLGIFEDPPHGVIFIERAAHLRNHAGQIGLPGGGMDAGDEGDLRTTALREMWKRSRLRPSA